MGFIETVSSWAVPFGLAAVCISSGIAKEQQVPTADEAAQRVVRNHMLLATIAYEDVCGAHPLRPAGAVYELPRGRIVEAAPECGTRFAIAKFKTNLDGVERQVFVTMPVDRNQERTYGNRRPNINVDRRSAPLWGRLIS